MSSRAQVRTQSPGLQRRGQTRSRSFQPSQKNLWKSVKTRRERSPNFRQRAQTAIIGRYRVEDTVVGRGAYSVVKPVTDLVSGNEFVAKIVRKDDLHKNAQSERDEVMQEVSILQQLPKQRHIVEFVELLEQPDEYLVILECLSNGDLCDAILECEDNRMSEARVKSFFVMMTEALLCCHSNSVSHRDVKPENMLLSENYELKLTDFGLAKSHRNPYRCEESEKTTELVGTLRYAAPELFKGHFDGELYDDYIADVWSLGVCLYVMLAGVFPFSTGRNMDEEGIRDLLCSPDEVEMPSCCSDKAVALLKKMLQKEPSKRVDIQDILSDPWCKDAWKPSPVPQPSTVRKTSLTRDETPPLASLPTDSQLAAMTREELVSLAKKQHDDADADRKRFVELKSMASDMEAKIIQLEKSNARLLHKLGLASDGGSTSAASGEFATLRSKVKQGTQMLSDMGGGSSGAKRSFTPGSAPRNGYTPSMKPASVSNSPIASRKAPRSMSPGVSTNMRSPDYAYAALSSPQPTPSKPRTLSPRPQKPSALTPSKGNTSSLSKYSRPDSPSSAGKVASTTLRHGATRSPVPNRATGNSRTATPPKKNIKRLTTSSPSRTPPVPSRAGMGLASPVSSKYASPSNNSPGPSTSTWSKPFSVGDRVLYSSKEDGSQCEGLVKFYGRVGLEAGGSIMIGMEITRQMKGTFKTAHEGKGYFTCAHQSGMLVPPRECRLLH